MIILHSEKKNPENIDINDFNKFWVLCLNGFPYFVFEGANYIKIKHKMFHTVAKV